MASSAVVTFTRVNHTTLTGITFWLFDGVEGIKVKVFWVLTSCSAVLGYLRFRGPCCVHLQDEATDGLSLS